MSRLGRVNSMRRLRKMLIVTSALALAQVSQAAAPSCWRMGSGQYFASLEFCVSSVQASRGAANFGPKNLLASPGSRRAWCSAVGVEPVGTWIKIGIEKGAAFRRLLVSNGYGATPDIHSRHGRIKDLKVEIGAVLKTTVTLADRAGLQTIDLGTAGEFASLRLEVLSYYPGTSAANVCLDYLTPDFEDLELPIPSQR